MKIVFFGSRHVSDIIWHLNQEFDLALVVTTDKRLVDSCKDGGIPFTQILAIDERLTSEIEKLKPDIGVVADFGIIIPKNLIDVFPKGILNIHPSLLPLYRGPTPVQTAILNGDKKTGITIIKIDEKLDHGQILYQEEREILPTDYTDKLLLELFKRSGEILPDLIRQYVAGNLTELPQNDSKASYTKHLTKEDGYINVNKPPEPKKLERMINALNPWPGVWTRYPLTPPPGQTSGSENLSVRRSPSGAAPQTSPKTLIKLHPLGLIHVEGKRAMSYKDFVNGYPKGKLFLQKLKLIANG